MTALLKIFLACWMLFALSCGAPGQDTVYSSPTPTEAEQQWQKAHKLERSGDVAAALTEYQSTCTGSLAYQRACYDYCRLLLGRGNVESGRQCAENFISKHPNNALSPVLGKAYASTYKKESQYNLGVARLEQLARDVEEFDVWDSLQYEKAALLRRQGMIDAEEIALMAIVGKGRWGSQLWDNSIWRVIAIQQDKGDAKTEEKLILRMLSAKESSKLIASYHSPYYDDALFRLGILYTEMGDPKRALTTFMKLANWKTSRLRDDALLASAKIKAQTGDRQDACKYLLKLMTTMPESSSYRNANRLFQLWSCE